METKIKNWVDLPREDLKNIPAMEALGYEVVFSYHDERADRITPNDVPHFPANFKKGDKHIWSIRGGWQTADLIGGYFKNHKPYFISLEELIKTVL